jgi:acetylornithine deacetylase/succinyl-diaminopimelate desuccinylase-like protein
MDHHHATAFINKTWDETIIPALMKYIYIPNKSPLFDPKWKEHGYMDQAIKLAVDWCHTQNVAGLACEVIELPGRTPLIFIEIDGESPETILLYGHLDKQPEMLGWDKDLSPWLPVLKDEKLYGRGGADDGYAVFASLTAIKALQEQKLPHARCIILIETCEESGSYDLPFYIDALASRIGSPGLVICLDSGCGNYEQLWMTTSLRGLLAGILDIKVLHEGIHSGYGSGIMPSCFLVLRNLLTRIEKETNGEIILSELQTVIPPARKAQAKNAADVLGAGLYEAYPFEKNVSAVGQDCSELILNRTWRAALSLTGSNGIPEIENAGNVTLPKLSFKLSMRLPPTTDPVSAGAALKKALEDHPPFGALITFNILDTSPGWNAPDEAEWLTLTANEASLTFFGKKAMYMGEGGSIPFMGMLGKKFPQAQFVITGVLGPNSNAHGPNEFLHIPTGKKLTACIAKIVAGHFKQC